MTTNTITTPSVLSPVLTPAQIPPAMPAGGPGATVVAPSSDVVPRAMLLELLAHAAGFAATHQPGAAAERQLRWLIEWAHRSGIGHPVQPAGGQTRVLVVLPGPEQLTELLRGAVNRADADLDPDNHDPARPPLFGPLEEIDPDDAAALAAAGRHLHDDLLRSAAAHTNATTDATTERSA